MAPLLQIRDLNVDFLSSAGAARVLNGLDLEINTGEFLGLVGESGSGKSVTANAILGLLPRRNVTISKGSILFRGKELLTLQECDYQDIRGKHISMVFQEPMNALNPAFKIGAQLGEIIRLDRKINKKEAKIEAVHWLARVGITNPEKLMNAYPFEFSGGMRQRVLLAMALSCGSELLLADEPTTALDVTIQAQILRLIKDMSDSLGTSVLLITHDLGVVAQTCQRVAVMYSGSIVEVGPVKKVLSEPRHPYTMALLKALPGIKGRSKELVPIPGSVPNLLAPPLGCRFFPRCAVSHDRCILERPPLVNVSDQHYLACWGE